MYDFPKHLHQIYSSVGSKMAVSFEVEANFPEKDSTSKFATIDSNSCSYNTFFNKYMRLNVPCIIKNVGLEWESTQNWVVENKPHFCYLLEKYGNSHVTIYDCNKRHHNSQETQTSMLRNYINNWNDMKEKLYYVKDWHLQNEFPEDKFYEVPVYFSSDWLNEFLCENNEDDYRFVYMGPVGTWYVSLVTFRFLHLLSNFGDNSCMNSLKLMFNLKII